MRARRFLPLLLALVILPFQDVPAQEGSGRAGPPPPEAVPRGPSSSGTLLLDLWFERKEALGRDDLVRAAGTIDEMVYTVRSERLDRVPWLARGFAFEGYQHLREGNYERAREAFDIARRFDPRLVEAQTGYAWAALYAGRGFGTFVAEYRRALALRWESFRREGRANVFLILLAVLWLLAIAVLLLLLLRYQKMLRHDVAERTPGRWPEGASRAAGWFVLLAPLFAWIGGVWLLLYWCVILARYMSGTERAAACIVCVAILLTGPLGAYGAAEAQSSANPTVLAVEEALKGGYGNTVISELQRTASALPQAAALRILLATTYERAGLYREAFEEYQRLLQVFPEDPRVLNNVGNLYMRTGQLAQAIVFYTRAAEADPSMALIFHNLSAAQSDALRMDDSEVNLRRLQQLDPELAQKLVNARGVGEEIRPITARPADAVVWAEVPSHTAPGGGTILGYVKRPTSMGALVALALLAWLGLARSPMRAQICIRCGEAFCGRCKKELGAKECCAQCIHLFIKREAIEPAARSRKLRQVERFARSKIRRARVASILLPGAGHFLSGHTLAGTVLLAAWLVPLTALLLRNSLLLPASLPVLDLPSVTTVVALAFMALLWLGVNLLHPEPSP